MRKELTDLQIFGLTMVAIGCVTLSRTVLADEMVHKFRSPSFNGVGASAHYLTIENQETNRRYHYHMLERYQKLLSMIPITRKIILMR